MSAVALADDEWEFPPEWKRDRKAEARLRAMLSPDEEEPAKAKPSRSRRKSEPEPFNPPEQPVARPRRDTIEVIFVGAALLDASEIVSGHRAPVRTRHMRSIDDLLAHIEDHDVDCAVVDQSRPTESRGLKLALLAAANRIKHLIVLAEPKSCAEAVAIHGVHEVLKAPVQENDIVETVVMHAATVTAPEVLPQVKRLVLRNARNAPPEDEEQDASFNWKAVLRLPKLPAPVSQVKTKLAAAKAAPALSTRLKELAIPQQSRWIAAGMSPLLAACVCFGGLVTFFMSSASWSVPVTLNPQHEVVRAAASQLDWLQTRRLELQAALARAETALETARADQQAALEQISVAEDGIETELKQQTKLLKQARAHVARLDSIVASANGSGDARTVSVAGLESIHQLAVVTNELAIKQIDADRLADRVAYLHSLRDQTTRSAFRLAASGDAEFANLAPTYSAAQTRLSDAGKAIAERIAETGNLGAALATLNGQIEALRATPAVQAMDKPTTVVFVPDANAPAYSEGTPLYACKLLVANCHQAGRAGRTLAGSATAEHPLFGNPVPGRYVEIELGSSADAGRSLLHAGRAPLFF